MKTMSYYVTQRIVVSIDESKFTPELMADFNKIISDFGTDEYAIEQHGEHIAMLAANGTCDFSPGDFVEGYGIVRDAGISVTVANQMDVERIEESKVGAA